MRRPPRRYPAGMHPYRRCSGRREGSARRFSASAAAAFRIVVPLDRVKVAWVWNGRLCMWQMLSWRIPNSRQTAEDMLTQSHRGVRRSPPTAHARPHLMSRPPAGLALQKQVHCFLPTRYEGSIPHIVRRKEHQLSIVQSHRVTTRVVGASAPDRLPSVTMEPFPPFSRSTGLK
jgi:hypothetical protein